jgi:hypothetical protein
MPATKDTYASMPDTGKPDAGDRTIHIHMHAGYTGDGNEHIRMDAGNRQLQQTQMYAGNRQDTYI